jgi:activator of 2-hydroxyglutaryl-CoA dehydratase
MTTARATAIKEDTADLMNPKTREEEAVALYYRSLVGYMLENLQKRFELARDVPQFTKPVSMVVAGGTSLANGFVEMFNEELAKADLSIPIASVRRAEDAFTSVVRGCLVAAALSSEDEDDD